MPQLGLLFMLVFLPMNMLSGSNTPLESMPPWLATVMQASPSTHFVSFAQAILYRGAGFTVVWPQFLIVALIGGLFFGLCPAPLPQSRRGGDVKPTALRIDLKSTLSHRDWGLINQAKSIGELAPERNRG